MKLTAVAVVKSAVLLTLRFISTLSASKTSQSERFQGVTPYVNGKHHRYEWD